MDNETLAPVTGVPATRNAGETAGARQASTLYDDGRPYDREVLTAEVRHHLGQGVLAMLEAGKRLIVLKEHEPHGAWLALLQRVGIGDQTARNMMRAARKFLGDPRPVLDIGSITTVYELAMLDDDELAELREGGTIAGVTLDDIQRMSPSQLRVTLRKERAQRRDREDAQRKRLGNKERDLEDLETKVREQQREIGELRQPGRVTLQEEECALLTEISRLRMEAECMVGNLQEVDKRIRKIDEGEFGRREASRVFHVGSQRLSVAMLFRCLQDAVGYLGREIDELDGMMSVPLQTEGQDASWYETDERGDPLRHPHLEVVSDNEQSEAQGA